jgi:ATP-dependent exoDNAse (exonuclease V) beta subunit
MIENMITEDEHQRQLALNPHESFIVQAPAGSGKTELLTQRFLVLLNQVNAPEEILAITFTKKASAEMRARIIKTLRKASHEPEPTLPHERKTWQLAKNVLKRDQTLHWKLLENPNRLRIQTIDSFNASLIKHLPILSHFGAPPEITDDPFSLYREAVQEFLSHLEENLAWSDAIAQLLLHRDNNLEKVQDLLVSMLAKRDQWLHYMMIDADEMSLRQELEKHLSDVVEDIVSHLEACFPAEHFDELEQLAWFAASSSRAASSAGSSALFEDSAHIGAGSRAKSMHGKTVEENDRSADWKMFSKLLLTQDLTFRKTVDKRLGFPAPTSAENPEDKALYKAMKQRMETLIQTLSTNEELHLALIELNYAPSDCYQESQWQTLYALYQVLRIVVAQLKVIFRHHGKIDYIENAQAALHALGTESHPTDLALALDYQIKHILIDEFQDTSNSQYRLIEKLIAGWESHDGRTLFVVGDPMQSIYRFREAEVGLFIRARKKGIAQIALQPLTLSVNFRSTPTVVEWINEKFQTLLPSFEDMTTGAVSYSHSIANAKNQAESSFVQACAFADSVMQAEAIVQLIQQNKQNYPNDTIAILVRARTHLGYLIPALKKANLTFRAIDIDPLDSRPVIQDLMALTRAMLHPADRVAWLSVLRAPWCGLSLNDLLTLSSLPYQPIVDLIQSSDMQNKLSEDGKDRLTRVAPILATKLADRRRYSLRLWIESTWLSLGGPACLDQSAELEDIEAYFELLIKLDEGGDMINLENLTHEVNKLFSAPNNQADPLLQIMTIHNAKGLEFDTVILPHLERQSPPDEKQLLLWMEKPRENASNALILAPIHATGEESDAIYQHIKKQHAIKNDYEIGRLLYVAATRAKKNLYLLMTKEKMESLDDIKMRPNSLLKALWPAVKQDVVFVDSSLDATAQPEASALHRKQKRLVSHWENPIRETAKTISFHEKSPGFSLSQNHAKSVGTVTHKILEQISHQGAAWWQAKKSHHHELYIKNHLLQQGVSLAAIDSLVKTVLLGIQNTLQDARGQWILSPHAESQSEFALTTFFNNEIKSLVIDRTFVDDAGIRWIIDYKTTHFSEDNLADFLQAEQQAYANQMKKYHFAMQELDTRPIRLGLYFPLIPAWYEWTALPS